MFSYLLGYTRASVRFLDHKVNVSVTSLETIKTVSKIVANFNIQQLVKVLVVLHPLQHLVLPVFYNFVHSTGYLVVAHTTHPIFI